MKTTVKLQIFAWALSLSVVFLAVLAWGQSAHWQIVPVSTLGLFPLFGLVAFSLMWSQYIASAARQLLKLDSSVLRQYYNVTGYVVLVAILLHPGLLSWQLWRDGGGLPPGSELSYVLPSLKAFVILGMINLSILLLFELRRIFANRLWWRYMTYLVDLVMVSIFVHALHLGTQLQGGWFRKIWIFYGASLAVCLIYTYHQRFSSKKPMSKSQTR